ncbi:hypothetical protein LCGC14_1919100 [marine sediment metagenome]|uniref:Uncharacterized protein n=1 Tax=marine sediment metagenome TaxID=412755 RepID=A0A0F9FR49_9ZZZZ
MTQIHRCNGCGSEDIRTVCNHTRFMIRRSDLMGLATCLDCKETVHISDALNNLGTELRILIEESKKCLTNLKATR